MKKRITEKEALTLLREGKVIQCRISPRDVVPVKNESTLNSLVVLSKEKVQMCEFYLWEEDLSIPKDAIELSYEEALEMIHEGEIIYGILDKDTEEITTRTALDVYYREAMRTRPILYWKG